MIVKVHGDFTFKYWNSAEGCRVDVEAKCLQTEQVGWKCFLCKLLQIRRANAFFIRIEIKPKPQ